MGKNRRCASAKIEKWEIEVASSCFEVFVENEYDFSVLVQGDSRYRQ